MKKFFRHILEDKIILWISIISVSLLFISVVFVIINYNHLPPFIPLFNQIAWGDARLGTKAEIFIPISLSFIIFFINLILSEIIYQETPLVGRILSVTSFIISFLTFLFIIRTVQIII